MEELRIVVDQYLPIRDVVFNSLREAILTGKVLPGERLMEKHLADQIGVSRTPIRESLRRLELEGLVEITPRKGATVSAISEKDIHDVLEIRAALESLGAKQACLNMTDENFEKIKKAADEFEKTYMEPDYKLVAEKDVAFHDEIFKASGNEKLIHIINNLRDQIYRFRVEYLRSKKYRKSIAEEHQELLKALEEKDAELASEIANKHIENQEKAVVQLIRGV